SLAFRFADFDLPLKQLGVMSIHNRKSLFQGKPRLRRKSLLRTRARNRRHLYRLYLAIGVIAEELNRLQIKTILASLINCRALRPMAEKKKGEEGGQNEVI